MTTLPVEIEEETAPVRFVEIADDEPSTPGLAILAGLQAASSTPLRMEPTVSAAPERPVMPERVQELVADTVARVLVSEPLHGGKREVRVELADSVLPQTEVRLWREEGRLRVEFITPAAVADGGLRDALPKLADAIQQRAPQSDLPVVSVAIRSSDFGAGSQDGRSRQQYQAYQEDDERA